jgi:hypothetical protein
MAQVRSVHGEKMIEVRIKFWTNNIASEKDHVEQKVAWDLGVLVLEKNTLHGIKPKSPVPFHSLADLPGVLEKSLAAHGVKLKHGGRSSKVYSK